MPIYMIDNPEPSAEELEMAAFEDMQDHFGQNFDEDYDEED